MKFSDIQISDGTLWERIKYAWENNNYELALSLLNDLQLTNKLLSAASLNELTTLIEAIEGLDDPEFNIDKMQVVKDLPTSGDINKIYLVY